MLPECKLFLGETTAGGSLTGLRMQTTEEGGTALAAGNDFELLINYDLSDPPRYHCRPVERDYFDWVMETVAANDATILWRTNLAGRAYFHGKHMAAFDHSCVVGPLGDDWHKVADILDKYDPLEEAVRAAHKHGARIFAYMPMNEFVCYRHNALNLIDPVWWEKPRHFVNNRDESRFFMGMPCFGYPAVRERVLNIIEEACDYGVDGLFLCTRSHSWRPGLSGRQTYPRMTDEFGFEQPVVEEYQRRHGVDIRMEEFDNNLWQRMKGDQYTEFLRMLRRRLRPKNLPIIININEERLRFMGQIYQPGGNAYRLYKDWERWVDEDLVDGIAVPVDRQDPDDGSAHITGISVFRETVGGKVKLYAFSLLTYPNPHPPPLSGPARPFAGVAQGASRSKSFETVARQTQMAKEAGAQGVHVGGYIHLFVDSGGRDIGAIGPCPVPEYWEAMRG